MLAAEVEKKIQEIIYQTIPGVFIVDIALHRSKRSLLSIQVDTDQGITLPECTEVNRALSRYLDESEPFSFPFILEVSSPGVGKPLKLARQYYRNIGRELQVKTTDGQVVVGKLSSADETGIVLTIPVPKMKKSRAREPGMQNPPDKRFEFSEIKEAIVKISFN